MSAGPYSIGSDIWPGTSKLIEEMGELHQVLGKLIAIGGTENYDHWDGTDIKLRLIEEIGDVQAALAFFVQVNGLDKEAIAERKDTKHRRFAVWHVEQDASRLAEGEGKP